MYVLGSTVLYVRTFAFVCDVQCSTFQNITFFLVEQRAISTTLLLFLKPFFVFFFFPGNSEENWCVHVYMYVCTYVCMYVYMHLCVLYTATASPHLLSFVCMQACMYVCMYVMWLIFSNERSCVASDVSLCCCLSVPFLQCKQPCTQTSIECFLSVLFVFVFIMRKYVVQHTKNTQFYNWRIEGRSLDCNCVSLFFVCFVFVFDSYESKWYIPKILNFTTGGSKKHLSIAIKKIWFA